LLAWFSTIALACFPSRKSPTPHSALLVLGTEESQLATTSSPIRPPESIKSSKNDNEKTMSILFVNNSAFERAS